MQIKIFAYSGISTQLLLVVLSRNFVIVKEIKRRAFISSFDPPPQSSALDRQVDDITLQLHH